MDAEFKKEQIGTLFVWVGAQGGGLGGWVVPRGVRPNKGTCLPSYPDHYPSGIVGPRNGCPLSSKE